MNEKLSMNIGAMVIQISMLQEQVEALKAELAARNAELSELKVEDEPV